MKYRAGVGAAAALVFALADLSWAGPRALSGTAQRTQRSRSGAEVPQHWRAPDRFPRWAWPRHSFHYPRAFYYSQDPRSIIVITPSADGTYYPRAAVVHSEPFYCRMHHVGFVSRAGFLDHISGTHKIPLGTASEICAESNPSCVIEGY